MKILKKLRHAPGRDRARKGRRSRRNRGPTRRGSARRTSRRWAKRGTRPSAPKDQRTASAYIFDAICPRDGKGAALVMPRCDTEAMNLHLAEIATQIAPGAHAALLCGATIRMRIRIASAETLPGVRLLPHLKSSPAACAGGVRNEAGEHGNEGRTGRGCG